MNVSPTLWHLYIDGASRGNPGLSGAGFCLYKNNQHVESKGFFLNVCTNNQAEYMGLLIGLFFSSGYFKSNDSLTIMSDSQLLIEQMKGHYKLNNQRLKELCLAGRNILLDIGITYYFKHILRCYNAAADSMANHGIENKIPLTTEFLTFLEGYMLHVYM